MFNNFLSMIAITMHSCYVAERSDFAIRSKHLADLMFIALCRVTKKSKIQQAHVGVVVAIMMSDDITNFIF